MCRNDSSWGPAVHTLQFPKPFAHAHPPVRNVNDIVAERLTLGERAAAAGAQG